MDASYQRLGFAGRFINGPPFGRVYLTIDAGAQAAAASFNQNRAYFCGSDDKPDRDVGRGLKELFAAAGVMRFFVWISPGHDSGQVSQWLEQDGFVKVVWTRYPTLALVEPPERPLGTTFQIREVDPDEVERAATTLGEAMGADYRSTAGKPGYFHFMAYDANQPVAVAALAIHGGLGYLTFASTAESHRRRGAQQALITVRVERARELACETICSETLTKLRGSLANLQRAGFREIYDKQVYCWQADGSGFAK